MAVIIENMDIPSSCFRCPLCLANRYGERYCFVTDKSCDIWTSTYERNDDCPMKEIEEG